MTKIDLMEKYRTNMSEFSVIIPTVGLGSRMGKLTEFLNKSLLPYKNKPVLAHIIDQFPNDTKFIIPVGYKDQQVIDFCNLAYPNKNIKFVYISNFTESFTGPGYTIKQCLDQIDSSFYYIPCDSYYEQELVSWDTDTYFVKKVQDQLNYHYTTFLLENDRIIDIQFKKHTDQHYFAFTGVMYIKDVVDFKKRLADCISPEIIYTIKTNSKVVPLDSWIDFGNLESYYQACKIDHKFDFSKPDEVTYFCNNKILKIWKDSDIARKKFQKTLNNLEIYPNNVKHSNEWLCYDYYDGTTLYTKHDSEIFNRFLKWLENDVWNRSNKNIDESCKVFYKDKTLSRIQKYLNSKNDTKVINYINGVSVKPYTYYLENINWDMLINDNIPSNIHGDLQFDNVIVSDKNTFKIIDWRHEFGNNVEVGDLYYDLAKLCGGLMIDYSQIKNNQFGIQYDNDRVYLKIPTIDNDEYVNLLFNHIRNKNYNEMKVKLLVPIIFWNMAPLHTKPFDDFLWYYGIYLFNKLLEEKV